MALDVEMIERRSDSLRLPVKVGVVVVDYVDSPCSSRNLTYGPPCGVSTAFVVVVGARCCTITPGAAGRRSVVYVVWYREARVAVNSLVDPSAVDASWAVGDERLWDFKEHITGATLLFLFRRRNWYSGTVLSGVTVVQLRDAKESGSIVPLAAIQVNHVACTSGNPSANAVGQRCRPNAV